TTGGHLRPLGLGGADRDRAHQRPDRAGSVRRAAPPRQHPPLAHRLHGRAPLLPTSFVHIAASAPVPWRSLNKCSNERLCEVCTTAVRQNRETRACRSNMCLASGPFEATVGPDDGGGRTQPTPPTPAGGPRRPRGGGAADGTGPPGQRRRRRRDRAGEHVPVGV